jgi:glyoxylase-like metal-dependent hydrolase (beta-lactamase superfamily II)
VSVRVGAVEITALVDAVGELGELDELYPETPPEAWEPYRALYPELFADTRWRLPCTCYLIRLNGTTLLVDTGVGPSGLWDWGGEREGLLPAALDEHGVGRDEIDVVFMTHLHIDHVGWNTDGDGEIYFPRARYVVHQDALAFVRQHDERPHVQRCIMPLVDRFETIGGDIELAPSVTAFLAPGHYPGHMGVRVASDGSELVLIADAAVHPALLDHPDWLYVSDGDPALCADTRRGLLGELVDRDVLVACGHYPQGGIGRIVRRNGTVVWEAV